MVEAAANGAGEKDPSQKQKVKTNVNKNVVVRERDFKNASTH